MKYANEIAMMKAYVKNQNIDKMSVATFIRNFTTYCNRTGNQAGILFWVTSGHRRAKIFLQQAGYSIGYYRRATTVFAGSVDPELLFLEISTKNDYALERETQKESAKALGGYFDAT